MHIDLNFMAPPTLSIYNNIKSFGQAFSSFQDFNELTLLAYFPSSCSWTSFSLVLDCILPSAQIEPILHTQYKRLLSAFFIHV